MSTVPAAFGGDVAMIDESERTVNVDAATAPNRTADAPEKSEPVIVTTVPPATGPVAGLTPVTAGAGVMANTTAGLDGLVPPGPWTKTWIPLTAVITCVPRTRARLFEVEVLFNNAAVNMSLN